MPQFPGDSGDWPSLFSSPSSSHHARHGPSRRVFLGGAAAATGASLGSGLLWPATGATASVSTLPAPKPTTATITVNGITFHVDIFGAGVDPSSITDFNGFVGVADVRGKGTATHPDGSTETLLFDTDMRFMKGVYVGVDGAVHHGTFGFVWLDLYRGRFDFQNFSTQVHDFNPGIHPYPGGLFWTAPLPSGGNGAIGPDGGVTIHLGAGTARMIAANLGARDFFNLPNALLRFLTPASVRATVSFDIRWLGPASGRSAVTSPPGSVGQLLNSPVTMNWSATNASGFRFTSHPSGTRSIFGQLGRVRNGKFAWTSDNQASTLRLGTAEASTACCSSLRRATSESSDSLGHAVGGGRDGAWPSWRGGSSSPLTTLTRHSTLAVIIWGMWLPKPSLKAARRHPLTLVVLPCQAHREGVTSDLLCRVPQER